MMMSRYHRHAIDPFLSFLADDVIFALNDLEAAAAGRVFDDAIEG